MQFLINFIELTYHYYILFYIIVYLIFILNLYFNNESSVNQKILNSIRGLKRTFFGHSFGFRLS